MSLLRLLGAEVILTRGGLMRDAVEKAHGIARTTPGAVSLEQFNNPANPAAHRNTTAQEILRDYDGNVDAFVAGVGDKGTNTGVGRALKQELNNVKIVAVEPSDSAVLSGKPLASHYIQGIGAGFIPEILGREVIDEVTAVSERAAVDYARRLAREEGILCGVSSIAAAVKLAKRSEFTGKRAVVILPDTGGRYMSASLASDLTR